MSLLRETSLLLLLCCSVCPAPPNVLIFLVDDLGYGDLSYTGHPTISSPNIDQLARDGVVLTQFYSASPVCTPSRASLLTGIFSQLTHLISHLSKLSTSHTSHLTLSHLTT